MPQKSAKTNIVRTHDNLYLGEDRKHIPKEYFKFIKERAGNLCGDVLDVGCATGDFLWFLNENYSDLNLHGVDVNNDLLDRARVEVPLASFTQGDITKTDIGGQYDYIFMNSVHAIFDVSDVSVWLVPLVNLLKKEKHSTIFVFGLFNLECLDVSICCRASSTNGAWEAGWSVLSQKTVTDYCARKGWRCSFCDFDISIDIEKNSADPLRSWTVTMQNGKRMIVNGLQLIHTLSLMTLRPFR